MRLALLHLPIILSACDPIRGYPGPELPPEQVALVKLEYDSSIIEVARRAADGQDFYGPGITLLPGSHSLEVNFGRVSGPPQCRSTAQVDYYDLNKCRKDPKRSCICHDFVEVYQYCSTPMISYACNGFMELQANASYQVMIRHYDLSKLVIQGPLKSADDEIRCYQGESYIKNDNRFVGRGLSAIISANARNPCGW